MEWMLDSSIWISFLTLTSLEVILGIDNIVFIALLAEGLPEEKRARTRTIGLVLALFLRIALLLGIAWVMGMNEPLFELFGQAFAGKNLLMLAGGMFLLTKAVNSMHDEVTGEIHTHAVTARSNAIMVVMQILMVDLVFSFDSVMTAVGLTENIPVIVAAMTVAMVVMIVAAGTIADFIKRFPTLKVLALAFILLIGVFLVAEGLGLHIPKGYIYFAMLFSLGVEVLNLKARKKRLAAAKRKKAK